MKKSPAIATHANKVEILAVKYGAFAWKVGALFIVVLFASVAGASLLDLCGVTNSSLAALAALARYLIHPAAVISISVIVILYCLIFAVNAFLFVEKDEEQPSR